MKRKRFRKVEGSDGNFGQKETIKKSEFKNIYFLLPRQIDMYETVLIQPFYFLHIKY